MREDIERGKDREEREMKRRKKEKVNVMKKTPERTRKLNEMDERFKYFYGRRIKETEEQEMRERERGMSEGKRSKNEENKVTVVD